ncbi:unnamed protein product [Symbiodinium natans]|uniref:CBS domain-containing protein n=1 Tax=Symbiodinium natans TaxID=878477 RepID=A0A812ULF4_9DINO|nr:unnamed protein product [Symbiodinium natans]
MATEIQRFKRKMFRLPAFRGRISKSQAPAPGSKVSQSPSSEEKEWSQDRAAIGNHIHAPALLADQGALPRCSTQLTLREVAKLFLSTGQAAGCVVNEADEPVGVITEDDILQSYVQGAPWTTTVGQWMRGGGGVAFDAPGLEKTRSEQPLREALPSLRPALTRRASRQLLVERQPSTGYAGGLLSARDIMLALAEGQARDLLDLLGLRTTRLSVKDIMEPVGQAPVLRAGFTVRELLQELLSSPSRAALVMDGNRIHGLATVADALWAFDQQLSHTLDAWDRLAARPGRPALHGQAIPADADLSHALTALAAPEGTVRHLVAMEPGTSNVVGVVSPEQVVSRRTSRQAVPVPSCAPEIKVELRHKSRDADSVVKKEETDEHPAASARIKTEVKVELQEGQEVKCEEVKCEEVKCEEPAPKKRAVMRRSKMDRELEGDVRSQVTLADIVARRETAKVTVSYTLSDAVDALVSTERTAAIVLDDGRVQGVLTENDVLAALVEGTSWQCQISEWLKGSYARLPGFMVPALTLPASASIADAAAEMTSLAEDGIGFTCHHMLVHTRDGAHGESLRILSALDIARGIIDTIAARTSRDSEAGPDPVVSVFTASDLTVEQAMKDRAGVSTCKLRDSLQKAFETMHDARQNCALIVSGGPNSVDEALDGDLPACEIEEQEGITEEEEQWQQEHGAVLGVITSSDALRAFSEHLRGNTTTVAGWLRGLNSQASPALLLGAPSTCNF